MAMKLEREEKALDREFGKMGVKPRVYHFRDVSPFNCVTVVTEDTKHSWKEIAGWIWKYTATGFNPATHLLEKLVKLKGIHGIAICDRRDQFDRQEGRTRAKRRLLRHLKGREFTFNDD